MTEELQEIQRDAVMRAAEAYDKIHGEMDQMRRQIADATVALRSADAQIKQLELSLATERNRASSMQNERDTAVLERTELLVMFQNIQAQFAAFVVPLAKLPQRQNGGEHVTATDS